MKHYQIHYNIVRVEHSQMLFIFNGCLLFKFYGIVNCNKVTDREVEWIEKYLNNLLIEK